MVHLSPIISPQPAVAEHLNKPVPNQPNSKPFFSPRFSLVLLILFGCWEKCRLPMRFLDMWPNSDRKNPTWALPCGFLVIYRVSCWVLTFPLTFLILFGCWENADSPCFFFTSDLSLLGNDAILSSSIWVFGNPQDFCSSFDFPLFLVKSWFLWCLSTWLMIVTAFLTGKASIHGMLL